MESSLSEENKVPSDINAHNLATYHSRKRSRGPYYCTKCSHRVSYGSSYSNQGYGLMCSCCVIEGSREEDISQTEYIRKNVWETVVPEKYFHYIIDSQQ